MTDIASYLLVTDTKTLLWANDLATGGPLTGATAAVAGTGPDLGPTDSDGLLTVATPASLRPPADEACGPGLRPGPDRDQGRSVGLRPGVRPGTPTARPGTTADTSRHWLTFATDRSLYRRTDTVNLWGMIRDRTTGKVPLERRGPAAGDGRGHRRDGGPDVDPEPGPRPDRHVQRLDRPRGRPGGLVPAGAGRRDRGRPTAGLSRSTGSSSRRTASRSRPATAPMSSASGSRPRSQAAFFEGSPVPGVPLRVVAGRQPERSDRQDRHGRRPDHGPTRGVGQHGDPEVQSVSVSPRRAEEGQIQGASRDFLVFPSSRMITAESRIATGRVRVVGHGQRPRSRRARA